MNDLCDLFTLLFYGVNVCVMKTLNIKLRPSKSIILIYAVRNTF